MPGVGFNPLRIRPYVTLPDPGEPDTTVSPQPVSAVVAPDPRPAPVQVPAPAEDDTPAYGIPVPPQDGPWPAGPAGPAHASHPAETVQLRAVPAAGHTYDSGGGGAGAGARRSEPARPPESHSRC